MITTTCDQRETILTARELLAIQADRHECWRSVGWGRKYHQCDVAPRSVVTEAVAILKERQRRKSCRGIAEAARRGRPGRILDMLRRRRAERQAAELEAWNRRVAAAKLALGRVRREFRNPQILRDRILNRVGDVADGAIRLAVRGVGPIGDQAEADLASMQTTRDFAGRRGRHHRLQETTVERIEALPDWSAALITLRDRRSFGRRGAGRYESVGGSSYRCYLVVRDSTTGEAHILRVAPKFGDDDTRFWHEIADLDHPQWRKASPALRRRMRRATPTARRIHAAVASTFGLPAGQYDPAIQA